MRTLPELLETLDRVLDADAARRQNADHVGEKASTIGRRLPLVHRTLKQGELDEAVQAGEEDATSWLGVLRRRTFVARIPPCTSREKAAGIPKAAYFFLGCGAYPEGLVGFVLDAGSVLSLPSSFTPFDTGSLSKHARPTDATEADAWDEEAKQRFLGEHLGQGQEALSFVGPYLAGHFRDPMDYVRHGQTSLPEFPVYHALMSTSEDRRAWTIEAQVHADVAFGRGGATIEEVVVARAALLEELPDDLLGFARVAAAENEVLESIAEGIEARIVAEKV